MVVVSGPQSAISKLVAMLSPRLRTIMNVFSGSSSLIHYELSEEQYADAQARDAFTVEFLQRLEDLMRPFQVRGTSTRLR